ncbi:restriction endonuclease [Spelaeicoccus albus]
MIRAGSAGEREDWALETGCSGAGFGEVAPLYDADRRDDVVDAVNAVYSDSGDGAVRNFAAQLWALRGRMAVGDLVVMPLKRTPSIALGIITSDYEYLADEPDIQRRHVRRIDWKVTDLGRARVKQDLLYSLGAFSTICQIKRNDAEFRLRTCIERGVDPGARNSSVAAQAAAAPPAEVTIGQEEADDSEANIPVDLARVAADSIASRVIEVFAGHKMESLVAEILRANDYVCMEHGAGTDDGIDLVAGKGLLGLEAPRIIVQVKSQASSVDSPTVQQLHGALKMHDADQGLLVAWGGLTKAARKLVDSHRFAVRVWEADDVVNLIERHYLDLSASIRKDLPLRQIWTLAEDAG